jgi:hypothetical protein
MATAENIVTVEAEKRNGSDPVIKKIPCAGLVWLCARDFLLF